MNDKQSILVVDDTPLNIAVLTGMLEDQYSMMAILSRYPLPQIFDHLQKYEFL